MEILSRESVRLELHLKTWKELVVLLWMSFGNFSLVFLKEQVDTPFSWCIMFLRFFFPVCWVFNALTVPLFLFLVSICPTIKLCQDWNIWYPLHSLVIPPFTWIFFLISSLARLVASPYQTYVFLSGLFTVLPIRIVYSAVAIRLCFCTIPWVFLPRTNTTNATYPFAHLTPGAFLRLFDLWRHVQRVGHQTVVLRRAMAYSSVSQTFFKYGPLLLVRMFYGPPYSCPLWKQIV
jgi:hypothetical protein